MHLGRYLQIYRCVYLWRKKTAYINLFSCKRSVNWINKSGKYFCALALSISFTLLEAIIWNLYFVHCPMFSVDCFAMLFFIRRVIVVVVFSLVNTIFPYPLVRIYLGNRASCIDPPLFMYESNNVRWIPCKPIGFPTNTRFSSLNLSMLFVVCFFIWLLVYCHISACNENGAVITVLKLWQKPFLFARHIKEFRCSKTYCTNKWWTHIKCKCKQCKFLSDQQHFMG